jgi:hypothetical protein
MGAGSNIGLRARGAFASLARDPAGARFPVAAGNFKVVTVAQIFPRWTNYIPHVAGAVAPLLLCGTVGAFWYWASPAYTDVGYQPKQPVPFSHKLHAGELGLDCRYCHATVELAARAAIPPTETCMNCHKVIQHESKKLALVQESFKDDKPIVWSRVHLLPDYAFFDHSIHLAAGVGCKTCHGAVDQMETVFQHEPLSMSWCLDCHRNPTPNLRPRSEVTNMAYDPAQAGYDPAKDPSRTRRLHPPEHCSGCHR